MSTDYEFPRRVYRDNQPVTDEDLNDNLSPAAERYSRLGPHNISSSVSLTPAIASMTIPHFVSASVDPGLSIAVAGYPTTTGAGPDSSYLIENSYEWQRIDNSADSSKDMVINITTAGTSFIKIFGWLQYMRAGLTDLSQLPGADNVWAQITGHSAEVQFALRVDGEIIRETITGFREEHEANFWPMRVREPKQMAGKPIPPRRINTRRSHSMGPWSKPVMLSWQLALEPGAHIVELVARRCFMRLDRTRDQFGDIYVYSRRLVVLEHPLIPAAGSGAAALSVVPFEPETTVSDTTLNTDRVDAIRDKFNQSSGAGVVDGSLKRGALNNNHLPSPLLAVDQDSISPSGARESDSDYPGYTSDTVQLSRNGGGTGWFPVDATTGILAAAPFLRNDNGGSGFSTSSSGDESFMLVLADVELQEVNFALSASSAHFSIFSLGYQNAGGAVEIVNESCAYINDFNKHIQTSERTKAAERTNVSLMAFLDLSTGNLLANDIDWWGVYVAGADTATGGANSVTTKWQHGAVQVFQFRE